ncbi:hypothetical protein [Mucilaginibacter sp.]
MLRFTNGNAKAVPACWLSTNPLHEPQEKKGEQPAQSLSALAGMFAVLAVTCLFKAIQLLSVQQGRTAKSVTTMA